MTTLLATDTWAIDDVPVPKDGRMPVGGARQYCGALGKRANCQVAVSVHAVNAAASCPLQWRLFLPAEWADDAERRERTHVPEDVGHREKCLLALDILDELTTWGLTPPVIVADAAYGANARFRTALEQRNLQYVLSIRSDVTARPFDAVPVAPPRKGVNGCRPQPRYRQPALSVAALAVGLGRDASTEVTWRQAESY